MAEVVRACPVDRDATIEVVIADLRSKTKEPMVTKSEVDVDVHAEAKAKERAEVEAMKEVEVVGQASGGVS